MKYILYLTIGFSFIYMNVKAQNVQKPPLGIYLKKFDLWIYPEKFPDTIVRKLNDTNSIKIYLRSEKGSATFYTYNLKNNVIIKGGYANALDTFKRYVIKFNPMGQGKIIVESYFEPVMDGEWSYYKDNILFRKNKYIKGDIP